MTSNETIGRPQDGAGPRLPLPPDHPHRSATPRRTAVRHILLDPAYEKTLTAVGVPEDVLVATLGALLHRLTAQTAMNLPVDWQEAGTVGVGLSFVGDPTVGELTEAVTARRGTVAVPAAVRVELGEAGPDGAPAGLQMALLPLGEDGRRLELHYDAGLFAAETADRLLGHFHTLLDAALAEPDRPVSQLRLLTADELHRILVTWNSTQTPLAHRDCLHQEFEDRTAGAPDATAVISGADRWTYRQVNESANRLAHHLRGLGVGPGTCVGICLDRSPELLIALLGVLKAGGAYVPLDPDYPAQRLATMVSGSSCAALISRSDLAGNLPSPADGHRAELLLLDRDRAVLQAGPEHDVESGAGPDDLCYVIYTSGSTGEPKPIALRHRGVLNNLTDLNTRFELGPQDRVLGLSSPSFDMSVYEFLGITAAGGTVVLPDPGRAKDPAHWAHLLDEHHVTVWNSAPALLELMTEHLETTDCARPLPRLRLAMLGGDWIPLTLADRIRALAPALRFISLGGATEASIHSTIFEVEAVDPRWTSIPYGHPMANQRTYILDEARRPVPPGVPGMLHLAGTGLARGYLEQPERTAERFFDWSYGEVSGERLYHTGDIARYGADGLIELLGRSDFQVKVNGLRVELGDIEAALRTHEGVKEAVVVAKPGAQGSPRLIGYVAARSGHHLDPAALRGHLARTLPDYLVPRAVVVVAAMPLSPNGKLDRKALPDPAPVPVHLGENRPDGPWEERIAAVWQELLGVDEVLRDDNFFALGGDSMGALRSLTRIDPALRWADLFQHPTVRALAEHLRATVGTAPTVPGT